MKYNQMKNTTIILTVLLAVLLGLQAAQAQTTITSLPKDLQLPKDQKIPQVNLSGVSGSIKYDASNLTDFQCGDITVQIGLEKPYTPKPGEINLGQATVWEMKYQVPAIGTNGKCRYGFSNPDRTLPTAYKIRLEVKSPILSKKGVCKSEAFYLSFPVKPVTYPTGNKPEYVNFDGTLECVPFIGD